MPIRSLHKTTMRRMQLENKTRLPQQEWCALWLHCCDIFHFFTNLFGGFTFFVYFCLKLTNLKFH